LFLETHFSGKCSHHRHGLQAARKEAATVTGEGNPVTWLLGTCDHSRIVSLVDLSPEVEDFVKAWVACSLREVQSQCAGPWVHSALTMNSIGFTEGKDFGKTYGKYQPL